MILKVFTVLQAFQNQEEARLLLGKGACCGIFQQVQEQALTSADDALSSAITEDRA